MNTSVETSPLWTNVTENRLITMLEHSVFILFHPGTQFMSTVSMQRYITPH